MECPKDEDEERATMDGGGNRRSVVVELPLGDAGANFDLTTAVCSHGLFMMAPNFWDPLTKTLQRPLRLDCFNNGDEGVSEPSLLVRIYHPSENPLSLHIRVFGADFLSSLHQQSLMSQVRRMLRLSEYEERNAREFQRMYGGEAKERFVGRVFRSPTLFEDMVKCILLCNCQWSRTLSMARALCELQLELQCPSFNVPVCEAGNSTNSTGSSERFKPKTPAGKESKRKLKGHKRKTNLETRFLEAKTETKADEDAMIDCVEISECLQGTETLSTNFPVSKTEEDNFHEQCNSCHIAVKTHEAVSISSSDLQSSKETEVTKQSSYNTVGNFPSPKELASLDEKFLAKRCNLGYRASWILNLARSVVGGRIQLRQLEEACDEPSLSIYDKLVEQLKEINGFGPYTRANVLMCMGFYHVIPTDTETLRHLKQVHARNCTIQTVQRDIEAIYGKYAPFQFLVYWSEMWNFYEEKFGKLSEMVHSDYRLITAANMRPDKSKPNVRPNKRSKPCREASLG